MAKFVTVDILLGDLETMEFNEKFGATEEVATIVRPILINVDAVESCAPIYGKDAEEAPDQCLLTLASGQELAISMSFKDFCKVIKV